MTSPDVIVVGGGIGGLAAAHALMKRGRSFVLLEAGDRWGGVIRSVQRDGFRFEGGPDTILAQKPEGVALCQELGVELRPTNLEQRAVYVVHRGELHPLPEGMVLGIPVRVGPMLRSRLFSWPGKVRMGLEAVVPRRRDGSDESIAGFFRRRLGGEALARLGEPLLGGIHAGDPDRLSMRSNFPRFVDLEAKYGSLSRGLRAAAPPPGTTPKPAFVAPPGGLAQLVSALVSALPPDALHLRTAVVRLRRDGDVHVVETAAGEWRARAVVLAAPAHVAAPLLSSVAPEAADGLARIRFATSATIAMGFRRADVGHPLDGYGLLIPRSEGRKTLAVSFLSTKFPGSAPDGHVLLRAFVGGIHDPEIVEGDDAALLALVQEEMADLLGFRGAPVLSQVFRWRKGTPQMEVGHTALVRSVESAVGAVPGLHLTGAGLRGTGLPDVIADAARTATAVA